VSNPFRTTTPPPPPGEVVATFLTYDEAVAYVDNLIEKEFPPTAIAIVGTELRSVERVRTRVNYSTVALRGALTGAWLGFIIGFVFVPTMLTSVEGTLTMALVGSGVGILLNVLRFSLARRKRGFASVAQFVAKEYQVQIQGDLVGKAKQLSGN
jgi:hypothetical protein